MSKEKGLGEGIKSGPSEEDWRPKNICEDCGNVIVKGGIHICTITWDLHKAKLNKKDELIFAYESFRSPIIDKTIINLQAKVKALEGVIEQYATHKPHCGQNQPNPVPCTCGLIEESDVKK